MFLNAIYMCHKTHHIVLDIEVAGMAITAISRINNWAPLHNPPPERLLVLLSADPSNIRIRSRAPSKIRIDPKKLYETKRINRGTHLNPIPGQEPVFLDQSIALHRERDLLALNPRNSPERNDQTTPPPRTSPGIPKTTVGLDAPLPFLAASAAAGFETLETRGIGLDKSAERIGAEALIFFFTFPLLLSRPLLLGAMRREEGDGFRFSSRLAERK
jgi:hypothetical protein